MSMIANILPDIGTVIKVVGVGGAGGNALSHMIASQVNGVEWVAINTDSQALRANSSNQKILLGTSGLGAGSKPDKGAEVALSHRNEIQDALEGAHMVFITAGMGGGTGTGAAPIVAEIAKEMGILTVGVVTKPFAFEGKKRMTNAEQGINQLAQHVDSMIVVLNERLMGVLGEDASMESCFQAADDVLKNAVSGICEIINYPGMVNVDFEDVRTVMGEMGRSMMGSATASGADRARLAAQQAASSPLLEGVRLSGAKGIIVNITSSRKSLRMKEVNDVMGVVNDCAEDAHVIFGAVYDETMGDDLRVTIIATGLGGITVSKPELRVTQSPAVSETVVESVFQTPINPVIQQPVLQPAMTSMSSIPIEIGDVPAVVRRRDVHALEKSGMSFYDIPAFLRKQAD